ncbi:MAG: ATPase [Bacteroidota bacterium]
MRKRVAPCSMAMMLLVCLCLPAGGIRAEVLSSSPYGFLVKSGVRVGDVPGRVYEALVDRIGEWWDPQHTFSGDARNLSLEARPGGCFCEDLPCGGGVRHMEVVFVAPDSVLRVTGALGPLQGSGLAGSMTWSFRREGDSTAAELTYGVGGYFEGDLAKAAAAVDAVLGAQLLRLKACVEGKKAGYD